jgi:hypothetical protein
MSSLRMLITALVLAALLAACQVTITPAPTPTPSESITAQGVTVDPTSRGSVAVPAGSARWVEVTYPSNAAADLMFFEIGNAAGVRVELYNQSGSVRQLVSRSASLFADRLDTLESLSVDAASAVEGSSVGIGYVCLGPCVATPYSASTRFVRLVNEGSTDRNNVQLFAYGFQFDDLNEPNDSSAAATEYTVQFEGDGPTGALEHVNDRDYFTIECGAGFPFPNLELTLTTTFPGDVVMIAGGQTYRPGQVSDIVPCGTTVQVRTVDGTAAPAGASTYSILAD